MTFELSLILIMVVIIIYIIVIKIFSILLQITGLPANVANYQGISLFTNCGFTTNESETILNNKFRRRISLACMITGNFFSVIIVSLIVSLISSLSLQNETQTYIIALLACLGFLLLIIIYHLKPVKNLISKLIEKIVRHFISVANKDNIITIIDNFGSNSIVEIHLHIVPEILVNKTIHESKIKSKYDINILSIKRNKRQIEITRNTIVNTEDVLLVFGSFSVIKEIFSINNNLEIKPSKEETNSKFNEIDLIDNYGSKAMVEVKINVVPIILENKTLFSSGLKEKYGINIMFLKRDEEALEVDKDTIVQNGDVAVVFGPYQSIKNIFLY
jgi:Trk K+ transport system NAD-binding subunit